MTNTSTTATEAQEFAVHKRLVVQAPIERAFSIFAEQMETWWPPSHHIGAEPFDTIVVEPVVGGRWFECDVHGIGCDWGKVLAWDPPSLVRFAWHLQMDWKFDPDPQHASEVEIRFTADGPSTTIVELTHSKFDRHGVDPEKLRSMFDSKEAWEGILVEFAKRADLTATE